MGPLSDIRVIEMAGIGPCPFCAQLLGDLGADVVRVDRLSGRAGNLPTALQRISGRNRRSVGVDVKQPAGREIVMRLVESADVLIEGYRPGVMERLGLGPEDCHVRNARLVYGRMTGWGQEGPMATMAGHDINYLGLSGALAAIGTAEQPLPPLNLVADYGGGALYLAFGVVAALVERHTSRRGQVVDAAMVDGVASLMTPIYQLRAAGFWRDRRAANMLDGGAPFYRTYRTSDGGWMAVGALEPQFYAELLAGLDLSDEELPAQLDTAGWAVLEERFAAVFATRTRREWTETFAGTDACVTPVLDMAEAPGFEHNKIRGVFPSVTGPVPEPAAAPRFSRTGAGDAQPPPQPGAHTVELLIELGYDGSWITSMQDAGVIA